MPTYYVEDYEEVTGSVPEVEAKIVTPPKSRKPKGSTVAEVK